MTKLELVKKISRRTGIERQDVVAVLESIMVNVKELVSEGETIYLRGFGSLAANRTKSGRSPGPLSCPHRLPRNQN